MSSLTDSNHSITLTPQQRARLRRNVPFVPDQLDVYPLDWAKDTCTCEVFNLGIRYTKRKNEVPHGLLGRTLEERTLWKR